MNYKHPVDIFTNYKRFNHNYDRDKYKQNSNKIIKYKD